MPRRCSLPTHPRSYSNLLLPPRSRSSFPTVVSHGSFVAGGWRLCSLEPGSLRRSFYRFYLRGSISVFLQDLIVQLAFKVPLVAPGRATTVEFAFFLPRRFLPPPVLSLRSSSPSFPAPSLALGFYRARYPHCRLRFILQLSLIQRIPWSVIITPGYSRLLLFPRDFRLCHVVRAV